MQSSNILEQLFEVGYATKEVVISQKLPVITIKTITFDVQEELEIKLKELNVDELNKRQFLQKYSSLLLSRTLVSVGAKVFQSPEEAKDYLKGKSMVLIEKLVQEQNDLEAAVRAALNTKELDKTFFPEGSQA